MSRHIAKLALLSYFHAKEGSISFTPQSFVVGAIISVWAIVYVGTAFGLAIVPTELVRFMDVALGWTFGSAQKALARRKKNGE